MAGEFPLQAPSEWRRVSLEEISEFITKGTTPTTLGFSWTDSGVLFLRSECVGENGFTRSGAQFISPEAHAALERSIVKAGDVLVTITGNVGRACLLPESVPEANINQHVARVRIRPDAQAVPTFVCYQLSHSNYRQHFARIVTGLAYPQLSLRQIREAVVALPSLVEQRKIAAILSSVDDTIEKSQAVVDQLEVVKKSLIGDLLTRGIPGRHMQFGTTTAGVIPNAWSVEFLGELFTVQLGKMLSKAAKTGINPKWYLRNANVQWERFDLSEVHQMDFDADELERFLVRPGDVLVCEGGEVGRCAIWRGEIEDCYYQKALHRLRPNDGRILPEFIVLYLQKKFRYEGAFLGERGQTTIAHLPKEKIEVLPVAVPPIEEQREIVAIMEAISERLKSEEALHSHLLKMKSALLDALLSGRIRVETTTQEAA